MSRRGYIVIDVGPMCRNVGLKDKPNEIQFDGEKYLPAVQFEWLKEALFELMDKTFDASEIAMRFGWKPDRDRGE